MDKTLSWTVTTITIIKNFSKYLIIPTSIFLFCPEKYLEQFNILGIKNELGSWISIVFIISISIIIVDLFGSVYNKIKSNQYVKLQYKNFDKIMETLNNTEKSIVYEIYINDSASFPINDASVNKLYSLKVIARPSVGLYFLKFSYCLQPWVVEWLENHPNYFEGSPND